MSATEIGKTSTVGSASQLATTEDRESAEQLALQDPSVSPARSHDQPDVTSPVPTVAVTRRSTEPAPLRTAPVERAAGVKLASISPRGTSCSGGCRAGRVW